MNLSRVSSLGSKFTYSTWVQARWSSLFLHLHIYFFPLPFLPFPSISNVFLVLGHDCIPRYKYRFRPAIGAAWLLRYVRDIFFSSSTISHEPNSDKFLLFSRLVSTLALELSLPPFVLLKIRSYITACLFSILCLGGSIVDLYPAIRDEVIADASWLMPFFIPHWLREIFNSLRPSSCQFFTRTTDYYFFTLYFLPLY